MRCVGGLLIGISMDRSMNSLMDAWIGWWISEVMVKQTNILIDDNIPVPCHW